MTTGTDSSNRLPDPNRRPIFYLFGALDLLALLRLIEQWERLRMALAMPFGLLTVLEAWNALLLCSLIVTGLLFFAGKEQALKLSLIQFPFRLTGFHLSFWFLPQSALWLRQPQAYAFLFPVAVFLEWLRVFLTIKLRRTAHAGRSASSL